MENKKFLKKFVGVYDKSFFYNLRSLLIMCLDENEKVSINWKLKIEALAALMSFKSSFISLSFYISLESLNWIRIFGANWGLFLCALTKHPSQTTHTNNLNQSSEIL